MATKKRRKTLTAEERRKAKKSKKLNRQQKQIVAVALVLVVLFSLTYVRKIVSLKAQERELIKEQEALIEERDRLKVKLKNVDNSEYIAEQARKQLRLVNPDEILFLFDEDEDAANE